MGGTGLFSSCRGKTVPANLCAKAYDDEDCSGWELEIPQGEQKFRLWNLYYYRYRNEIEAVIVRRGCTLTLFAESNLQGKSVVIRAGNSDRVVSDLEDIDKSMSDNNESLRCTCNTTG